MLSKQPSKTGNTQRQNRMIARPGFTKNEYNTLVALSGDEGINRYIRRLIMEDAKRRNIEFVDELPKHGGSRKKQKSTPAD